MSTKTAIYARVSTDDQNLDSQLDSCRDWCKSQNLSSQEYLDKASGGKTSRPALDKLLKDINAGKINCIVCYKLDRLGRSLVHLAQMVGEFDAKGVALVCPSQGIDTRADNPAGRLQMHVLMAVAEFERSLIRERTRAGLKAARTRGVILGRPVGSGRVLPIQQCKDMMAEGKSIREACRALNVPLTTMRWGMKRELQIAV